MPSISLDIAVASVQPGTLLSSPGALVLDVRSPSEFADDHMPGAQNLPLFDDAERVLVGTLYAKHSPEVAFDAGRRIVRNRIGALAREVAELAGWPVPAEALAERVERMCRDGIVRMEAELAPQPMHAPPGRAVAFCCSRGGLRSRSLVAFFRGLGLERAVAIAGGYKAWRAFVQAELARVEMPRTFVLRGLTGVGKTLVLREVERLRPGWTLDLEECAGHRSSILGMVGMEPRTQRGFETALVTRLSRGLAEVMVVEGESRKVGDVVLPERTWRALDGGTNVELVASDARRVDVLIEDYLARESNRPELARQLPFIEKRLGTSRFEGTLVALLEARRDRELVALLLEHYYDPLYRHSEKGRRPATTIDAGEPARAAAEVVGWIERTAVA